MKSAIINGDLYLSILDVSKSMTKQKSQVSRTKIYQALSGLEEKEIISSHSAKRKTEGVPASRVLEALGLFWNSPGFDATVEEILNIQKAAEEAVRSLEALKNPPKYKVEIEDLEAGLDDEPEGYFEDPNIDMDEMGYF